MFGLKLLPRFYRLFRREYYIKLDSSQLFLNFLVQRIFRLNSDVPFSLHYTSRFQGYKNMKISSKETLVCCAVSGGCYFTAFDGTTLEKDLEQPPAGFYGIGPVGLLGLP